MQDFDEWLKQLDRLFVEALDDIENTPDQRAYWATQETHWQGGGDRAYIDEYHELVRLHAKLRRLMNSRTRRLRPES
jgi:hypothetical protein